MKSYTDLKQSKKLAEFLPLESADMFYTLIDQGLYLEVKQGIEPSKDDIPCWSLTALLNILPSSTLDSSGDHHYRVHCKEMFTDWYDNPIDCCVAMIDRLHKQMIYDFNNS